MGFNGVEEILTFRVFTLGREEEWTVVSIGIPLPR